MDDNQRNQYRLEIIWLENEIEKLAKMVIKKPRKQKQIDTYRMQIKQKEYQIELGV